MKKYISPVLSIILGILSFGLYAAPFYSVNSKLLTINATAAYDYIIFDSSVDSITAFSIFSVILLIIAGLLIISGITLILQYANILKCKPLTKVNNFLQIFLFLISLSTFISYIIFIVDLGINSLMIGATSITILIVSLISMITSLLTTKNKKSKK